MEPRKYRAAIYLDYELGKKGEQSPSSCKKAIRAFIKSILKTNKNVKILGISDFSVVIDTEDFRYNTTAKKENYVYKEEYYVHDPRGKGLENN